MSLALDDEADSDDDKNNWDSDEVKSDEAVDAKSAARHGGDNVFFSRGSKESGSETVPHCQRWDYVCRPKKLDGLSLYAYTSTYKKVPLSSAPKKNHHRFLPDHPQYATHALVQLTTGKVPVIIGPRIPSPTVNLDRNAHLKLVQFKAFRRGSDLRLPDESWPDALRRFRASADKYTLSWLDNIDALHEGQCQRDQERKEQDNEDVGYRNPNSSWRDRDDVDFTEYDGAHDFMEIMYDPDLGDADESEVSKTITPQFLQNLKLEAAPNNWKPEQTYCSQAVVEARCGGFTLPAENQVTNAPVLHVAEEDGKLFVSPLRRSSEADRDSDDKDGKDEKRSSADEKDGKDEKKSGSDKSISGLKSYSVLERDSKDEKGAAANEHTLWRNEIKTLTEEVGFCTLMNLFSLI